VIRVIGVGQGSICQKLEGEHGINIVVFLFEFVWNRDNLKLIAGGPNPHQQDTPRMSLDFWPFASAFDFSIRL
jgi:hypothetical protein